MSFLGLGRTREKVEAWLVQYKWCGLAEEWCKIFKMHCCNHSFLYISNIAVSNGLITCVGRSDFDLDFFPMRLRMLPSTWMIKNSFQIFGLNILLEPTTLSSHGGFFVIHRISYGPFIKLRFSSHSQGAQTNFLEKEIIFCHPEGPQPTLRISYHVLSKPKISNLFTVSKSIKYQILNIEYRRYRKLIFLHFLAEKALF